MTRRSLVATLALFAVLCTAAPAVAEDGDGREVRATGSCTGSSRYRLRLRAEDGKLEIRFEIDASRAGAWSVILLHERRIVYRGVVRTRTRNSELRVRRLVDDWYGRDAIGVRASGPQAETCRASTSL